MVTEEEVLAMTEAAVRRHLEVHIRESEGPLVRLASDLETMNNELEEWNRQLARVFEFQARLEEMEHKVASLEARKARENAPRNFHEALERGTQGKRDRPKYLSADDLEPD